MKTDEIIWRKVRFALLFVFAASLMMIILTKFLFQVPVIESVDLLNTINHSEKILIEQKVYAAKVKSLQQEIDSLDFAIFQVQRTDEVKEEIFQLQNIYKKNNMNTKYLFGLQASKTLKIYFDIKEELSSTRRNNEIIKKSLEECKANI